MLWANLLHIYQPPEQRKKILLKIAEDSYFSIIKILKKRPKVKITLNINGSLTEQLPRVGLRNIIQEFKFLAERGQVEFTGSAKYHIILPLLPEEEIIRQIKLNEETNKKFFGKVWRPRGFFLPELCYSKKAAKIIEKLGYSWIILDEIAYSGRRGKVSFDKRYSLKDSELKIVFRNRGLSDLFFSKWLDSIKKFERALKNDGRCENFLITCFDGENLGHHRTRMAELWAKILNEPRVETLTFSELLARYEEKDETEPVACSWASNEEELTQGIPYPLWQNPKNPIHTLQWELTYLVTNAISSAKRDPNFSKAREKIDQSLFSCQYWWASGRPWWKPEMIKKGAQKLVDVLDIFQGFSQEKKKGRRLYGKIVFLIKEWERTGKTKAFKRRFK